MKKTEYFYSEGNFYYNQIKQSISTAVKSRDSFLLLNNAKIAKIENESIQFTYSNLNQYVTAVITLSYYEKE